MRVTDPARGLRIVSGMMVAASVAAALLCARPATGGDPATDAGSPTYFQQHIQLLLETRCLSCHQAGSTVSRLDLSTRAAALRGGERGPALVPGNPEASLLIQLVTHRKQPFMPMGGERLPQAENRPPQPVDLGRRPLPRGRVGPPVPEGRQASRGAETLCRAGKAALRIHLSEMPLTGDQGFRARPLQPGGHAGRW